MNRPNSKKYTFKALLSENNLCQSWEATNVATGERCLIKYLSLSVDTDRTVARAILSDSYDYQRQLGTSSIVKARRRVSEPKGLFIEYPFLAPDTWRELDAGVFVDHVKDILVQVCRLTDYLHAMGLVHGDLKLSNFLFKTSHGNVDIALVDLDFLSRSNVSPRAAIFGTPGHIAPEITDNDRIVAQSDNYSLGVSIRDFIAQRPAGADSRQSDDLFAKKVSSFVDQLVLEDYLGRPHFLLGALHKYGIIDDAEFALEKRTVLAMELMSRFRTMRRDDRYTTKGLQRLFQDNCHLLGFHTDLIEELAKNLKSKPVRTFGLFRNLIGSSQLNRVADYWHISVEDEALQDAYEQLSQPADEEHVAQTTVPTGAADKLFSRLNRAMTFIEDNRLERAYFEFKQILDSIPSGDCERIRAAEEMALSHLGSLARSLNRPEQAAVYLERLLERSESNDCMRSRLYDELCVVYAALKKFDEYAGIARRALKEVESVPDSPGALTAQRHLMYMHSVHGDYEESNRVASCSISTADRKNLHRLHVMLLYTTGMTFLRQGMYDRVAEVVRQAMDVAELNDLLQEFPAVIGMYAEMCIELADYEKSARYAKTAAKFALEQNQYWALSFVTGVTAYSYIRLADFPKVEYWFSRNLSYLGQARSITSLRDHLVQRTFMLLNRGMPAEAKETGAPLLELTDGNLHGKALGKIRQNLAGAELHSGNLARCNEHVQFGRKMFDRLNDNASLEEINFYGLLAAWPVNREGRANELVAAADRLWQSRGRYFAVKALFHVLLSRDAVIDSKFQKIAAPMKPLFINSKVPLFGAMNALLESDTNILVVSHLSVAVWKKAFTILLDGEQKYLAMLTAQRVADFYRQLHQLKHARKFLQQALKLARALSNKPYVTSLDSEIQLLSENTEVESQLISSFHQVSTLLHEITDYEEVMRQLVQFAVDQTGAERGVLLLRRAGSSELRIGAAVNCDDASLKDISDFSTQIATAATEDRVPILIDNALHDKRTKSYQSVLYHNILSVASIPLTDGEASIGVLYLDHHSIPALFEESDFKFIAAIANFIAVAVTTAQDYRTLERTKSQLMQDAGWIGDREAFITDDRQMKEMLSLLRQLSNTDTSVLLVGETGTGKEILCQLIHKWSQRSDRQLIKINSAAFATELVEGELFGVGKNVATGVAAREGKFEAADGGTLFLDEIGDMPLPVQAKILRAVELQEFERVGTNRPIHADVRLIYATNRKLSDLIAQDRFREDLFHRISKFEINITPLRERPGDIPLLVEHFVRLFSKGHRPPLFSNDVMKKLVSYHWPGNVRELRNFVESFCMPPWGRRVTVSDIHLKFRTTEHPPSDKTVENLEARRMKSALKETGGNITRAAELLGMNRTTLRRKAKKHGLL